ncbi:MAG: bifunctional (p)ppGpp synthetase/guanosine-3',5'-bis(diphosphate) 3'-pyrophosphohydrolase [Clostridiales bacterium]|nr:bifunctional (p)ppGpp synthetase/guanosine-3',5'-bis(diphosphate) 3'-pyrophosphohydrolase [Clostridiales bacterium]
MLGKDSLPLFERAVVFAAAAHCGATRKGSRIPYLSHPVEAAAIVAELTDDQELVAAAVLHDVIEDTDVTIDEIREAFGERIACYVSGESEDKRRELPPESTWVLRKQETIRFLTEQADRNAKMLALADKLSNLRSISRDVEVLGDRLWDRFHQKDKAMHGWMYRQIAEALKELSGYPAWKEYDRLIREVFEGESRVQAEQESAVFCPGLLE